MATEIVRIEKIVNNSKKIKKKYQKYDLRVKDCRGTDVGPNNAHHCRTVVGPEKETKSYWNVQHCRAVHRRSGQMLHPRNDFKSPKTVFKT